MQHKDTKYSDTKQVFAGINEAQENGDMYLLSMCPSNATNGIKSGVENEAYVFGFEQLMSRNIHSKILTKTSRSLSVRMSGIVAKVVSKTVLNAPNTSRIDYHYQEKHSTVKNTIFTVIGKGFNMYRDSVGTIPSMLITVSLSSRVLINRKPNTIDCNAGYDIIANCFKALSWYVGKHRNNKVDYVIVGEEHQSGAYHYHIVVHNLRIPKKGSKPYTLFMADFTSLLANSINTHYSTDRYKPRHCSINTQVWKQNTNHGILLSCIFLSSYLTKHVTHASVAYNKANCIDNYRCSYGKPPTIISRCDKYTPTTALEYQLLEDMSLHCSEVKHHYLKMLEPRSIVRDGVEYCYQTLCNEPKWYYDMATTVSHYEWKPALVVDIARYKTKPKTPAVKPKKEKVVNAKKINKTKPTKTNKPKPTTTKAKATKKPQ